MSATSTFATRCAAAACALVVAAVANTAMADDPSSTDAAKARYEKERAACLSGTSQQDKAACLKELGAVAQERKEGKIQATPKDAATLQQNALQRCMNVPASDKADCEARARGAGTTSGSVGGGGMVKETVTTKVLPRGSSVPEGSTQVGTVPGAVLPAPPSFASSPKP